MMENVMESNYNILLMGEAPVGESKYAPLNLEEFQKLKTDLESVRSHLPEHLMHTFWVMCNRIRGERANQPCSCRSSSGLWARCVSDLREFVKGKSE
jgi:hypothetical protein